MWHDGVRELPNSWHWRVEHDNGTGSVTSEINIELSRINLGLPLICKVNSSALDAPITKKIHVNMEVAPNQLTMERPHDKEKDRADVPEGGRLSVTCIAKGAKPQAYIYWNSEPELSKVSQTLRLHCYCLLSFQFNLTISIFNRTAKNLHSLLFVLKDALLHSLVVFPRDLAGKATFSDNFSFKESCTLSGGHHALMQCFSHDRKIISRVVVLLDRCKIQKNGS